MKILKEVRPGDGFKPSFTMTTKMNVNGENAHPLYQYLRAAFPTPLAIKGGVETPELALMKNPNLLVWSPVTRSDVAWNFESFLVDREGNVVKRYHPSVTPNEFEAEIQRLLA
eukprot:TRINITY_DN968_c1_g2_i1.p1 TRINITY_DN968_c1_g2~~TRINITY_DN968_c1_g2_i1.p1  ORF type:complete len:113 (-),score=56.47 TRINITY_DN968_c1_g2_i1:369-707(-)